MADDASCCSRRAFVLAPRSARAHRPYPTKPIRIIIGPSPDAVARVVGQHLQETWGQPVVIEARTGAGGQIAATAVATAEPDGHTLLFATPSYTLNTVLKTASYDVLRDFAPAGLIGTGAYTLVVHPSVPANSVAELIALAKAQSGQAQLRLRRHRHRAASSPARPSTRLPGVNIVHIPYRNVNEAMNGVVGNHVQMFVAVSLVAKQQMQSGTVRALATTGAKRSTLLPELPTIAESGYPEYRAREAGTDSGAHAARRARCSTRSTARCCAGSKQPNVKERLIDARAGVPAARRRRLPALHRSRPQALERC